MRRRQWLLGCLENRLSKSIWTKFIWFDGWIQIDKIDHSSLRHHILCLVARLGYYSWIRAWWELPHLSLVHYITASSDAGYRSVPSAHRGVLLVIRARSSTTWSNPSTTFLIKLELSWLAYILLCISFAWNIFCSSYYLISTKLLFTDFHICYVVKLHYVIRR